MNKEQLIPLIEESLSTRDIAKRLNSSQTNIRYWLKTFNLKTKKKKFNRKWDKIYTEKLCPRCKTVKPIKDFVLKKKTSIPYSYCLACLNQSAINRQREFKKIVADYKGGKCQKCGYNKCLAALEFHHTDPSKKDFSISKVRLKALTDEIKKEIDKCLLLCANCHREEHWSMIKL